MIPLTKLEEEAIFKEAHNDQSKTLEEILLKYPDFHWSNLYYKKTGDTILHIAARLGHASLIQFLLKNFTPPAVNCKNKDDKTALHDSAQFSQYECCKILVENGADVNALKRADWTPLMLACTKIQPENSYKTVKLLLDSGGLINYVNKDGWSALHLTCREGDVSILNLLVSCGLLVQIRTKNGRNALHIAALHGSLDVVNKLLSLGLNINDKDNCGNTPLHEAILGGNIAICEELISNKADVNCKNNCGFNILHLASSEDLKSDRGGFTALHCAARKNQKGAFEYLKDCGGDVNIPDDFGRQACDYFS